MNQGVEATCRDCGAVQRVRVTGMTYEQVVSWAGLLDGSSPLYVHPPADDDPTTPIGRCGECGGRYKTRVFGFHDAT